jgi:hypothetical protein
VGRPDDDLWGCVQTSTSKVIEEARPFLKLSKKDRSHWRGRFPALFHGISYGGGQPKPGMLVHSGGNEAILRSLISHPSIARIAGFASGKQTPLLNPPWPMLHARCLCHMVSEALPVLCVTICNIYFVFLCLPKSLIRSYLPFIFISTFRRLHSHPLSLLHLLICFTPSSLCFLLTFPSFHSYLWRLSTLTDTPTYCEHSIDCYYVLPSLT